MTDTKKPDDEVLCRRALMLAAIELGYVEQDDLADCWYLTSKGREQALLRPDIDKTMIWWLAAEAAAD